MIFSKSYQLALNKDSSQAYSSSEILLFFWNLSFRRVSTDLNVSKCPVPLDSEGNYASASDSRCVSYSFPYGRGYQFYVRAKERRTGHFNH